MFGRSILFLCFDASFFVNLMSIAIVQMPRPVLSGLIYFTFIVFVTLFCEFSVGDDTPGATA